MENYDFSGWATRVNMRCSDGRTIMKDAFKHCDGAEVPLVWNHQHSEPENILGKALLHNCDEGVYVYGTFNDSESGQTAKLLVQHGDVKALSIYANQLKEHMSHVSHGTIREVSLVLAGANPGAYIENVIKHGDDSDDEAIIYSGEDITLAHSDKAKSKEESKDDSKEETVADVFNTLTDKQKEVVYALIGQAIEEASSSDKEDENEIEHSEKEDNKEDDTMAVENKKNIEGEETVADVFDSLTDKQKEVVYAIIGQALEEAGVTDEDEDEMEHSEGGDAVMKHNLFDNEEREMTYLTHADQEKILDLAKSSNVGSFKRAMEIYASENKNALSHGIDNINQLFPDFEDVRPGAPELLERDQSWVSQVMKKAYKSPVSRVRTRQIDARAKEIRAKGYNSREAEKTASANLKLLMRTTDPQTVYRRDNLHRDDVVDITDFDVVAYQKNIMKRNLEEDIALAALVGDGREDTDPDKIHEEHIRSVWHDDDLYTIKASVDVAAARTELQGTNTGANFGDNYVYTEAIITAALYAREKYKGKGQLDFYCTPHLLNVMLLARDMNGRRIYDTKDDVAKALNVGNIYTVEQFADLKREDAEGKSHKLLGIFVNMANYQFGCVKGGEITNFEDFDIDFNSYKYLMETRLSGALIDVYSAIALEEPVATGGAAG